MESIKLNSGMVNLEVYCDDIKEVISFNPDDVRFVNSFYQLFDSFKSEEQQYKGKMLVLEKDKTIDEYGVPKNMRKRLELITEYAHLINRKIDSVFGAGTSEKVFHGAIVPDMYRQFFEGVAPYISKSREEKMGKYLDVESDEVMS